MPFGKNSEAGPPWRGFQAWRAHFDALLLQRARDAGATVYQSCGAVDLLRGKAGRVTGVVKSPKRSGIERTISAKLRARFVVDATGGRHWLARRLALAIERHSPRLIARYGYVDGTCPGRDETPGLVADSDGWTWTARVRPRRYAWTRLSLRDSKGEQHLLPPEELRGDGLHQWGKVRGADVGWRVVVPAAGQGYFLVGDAAAVLDPASSHGVLKAIMSGMMAAHLIAQVVCYDASESAAAQRYSDWIRLWFDHDVAGLLALYGRLPKPPSWVRERGSFSGPPGAGMSAGSRIDSPAPGTGGRLTEDQTKKG
jgi:flavin-dependent dehydrogenase